uniref:Uncharacterized protein n=1 Tax=Phocoena sinus TaxID=42100 RepID=A0A8C9C1Z4_PHOSS
MPPGTLLLAGGHGLSISFSPCLLPAAPWGFDSGFVPSVQNFDKKLTEADAYLQILIEQLKLFDDKLQNCKDDEQRKKTATLKETTNKCWVYDEPLLKRLGAAKHWVRKCKVRSW